MKEKAVEVEDLVEVVDMVDHVDLPQAEVLILELEGMEDNLLL